MSKLSDALDILRTDEGEARSDRDIAEELDCSERHVCRARSTLRAERLAAQQAEEGTEAERLLANICQTDEAEEVIELAIADAKDELKELKDQLKEIRAQGKAARKAARESYPLFDRPEEHSEGEGGANGHQRRLVAVG
jgi:chromosome segregation ATPase